MNGIVRSTKYAVRRNHGVSQGGSYGVVKRSFSCVLRTAYCVLPVLLSGCVEGEAKQAVTVPGGDPEIGQELVYEYACGSCHVIPGVSAANKLVGPPLDDWAERQYIAGSLWNTPDNLIAWIENPQQIEPGTAMPNLGVTPEEARHMAAYLFTLGDVYGLGPPHPFPAEWLDKLKMKKGADKPPTPWSAPINPDPK